ncbi:MAG: winged helix-turn-helix transcriptional regulator [Candidatus Aegiribacteria sp.]|nr:winged helix-turn-helix transcriptional regulator [Candidatus Aegiribacteria sp.]
MLEPLLGSTTREQVLIFIQARGSGYAREIAGFFKTGLDPVQKQLKRLEAGGILLSCFKGRTLLYRFNPQYRFIVELESFLKKVLRFYPADIHNSLITGNERTGKSESRRKTRYIVKEYRSRE